MFQGQDLEDFDQISEEAIRTEIALGDSSLKGLLAIADEWREAGMTPVFIGVGSGKSYKIGCVAKENFGKYVN